MNKKVEEIKQRYCCSIETWRKGVRNGYTDELWEDMDFLLSRIEELEQQIIIGNVECPDPIAEAISIQLSNPV